MTETNCDKEVYDHIRRVVSDYGHPPPPDLKCIELYHDETVSPHLVHVATGFGFYINKRMDR